MRATDTLLAVPKTKRRAATSPSEKRLLGQIGRNIKRLLQDSPDYENQEMLAKKAEIDPGLLSRLINGGRRLNTDQLARLAAALSVEPEVLLYSAVTEHHVLPPPSESKSEDTAVTGNEKDPLGLARAASSVVTSAMEKLGPKEQAAALQSIMEFAEKGFPKPEAKKPEAPGQKTQTRHPSQQ